MDKETLLQLGADEAAERAVRHRAIEILDYEPSRPGGPLLCREGTVTVFVARKGAEVLDRIRAAANAEAEADVQLANYFIDSFRGRKQLTRYRAWTLLHNSPVFATVRYGGTTLATNIFTPPDAEVVIFENPYNGAQLNPGELTLVEHPRDETTEALEAIALRHPPSLTEAEAAAIEQVPEDQLELSMAPNMECCESITEYAQRAVFVTFTVTCMCLAPERNVVAHLADAEVAALGPARSARRLMAFRREALGHDHPSDQDGS